jgi:actin related protein 2/3 complex subunit 2
MILLETSNRILHETIMAQFVTAEADIPDIDDDAKAPAGAPAEPKKKQRDPISIRICDMDDASYKLEIDAKARDTLVFTFNIPCYRDIREHGAEAALKADFGNKLADSTDEVKLTLDLVEETKNAEQIAEKIAKIKFTTIGGVFKHFYSKLAKDETSAPYKFDLRTDTTIYFVSDKDRVTTIFGLDFTEKVDKVLARVFMQEFAEARRRIQFAPPVTFTAAPPAELAHWKITEATGNLGFISFSVLKSHVKDEKMIDRISGVMQSFRNYIQYHIKCSKSYFHSRMRARVVSLLKVLNRAKVEDPEKDKDKGKKTISGKTFRRAA